MVINVFRKTLSYCILQWCERPTWIWNSNQSYDDFFPCNLPKFLITVIELFWKKKKNWIYNYDEYNFVTLFFCFVGFAVLIRKLWKLKKATLLEAFYRLYVRLTNFRNYIKPTICAALPEQSTKWTKNRPLTSSCLVVISTPLAMNIYTYVIFFHNNC